MVPAPSTLYSTCSHLFNYGEGSSSSHLVFEPFNLETRLAFGLMLEGSRNSSRERVSLAERQQMIDWVTETVQQRGLLVKDAKRRSWTKAYFFCQNRKLWQNPDKTHEAWEVIAEPEILDAIIATHNSLGHAGQDTTAQNVSQFYYGVSREEVVFFIKLCEICHKKAHSKSKGPLVPIISTKLFERIQIDLIDMRSTPNITPTVIYKWIAHLVYCMSKIRMLLALPNKKAVTVATAVNRWICIYGAMDIL